MDGHTIGLARSKFLCGSELGFWAARAARPDLHTSDRQNETTLRRHAVEGEHVTVLELRVHPNDLGRVIGREGHMAESIRTILAAAGMKLRKRVTVEILE